MDWMHVLFPHRLEKAIDAISRQIAERCQAGVMALLSDDIRSMSLSEARGYVRARAGKQVRLQTILALKEAPNPVFRAADRVVRVATERVVHRVIRELLTQPAGAIRIQTAA